MADQTETAGTPSPATAAQSVGAQPVGFKGWYAVVMMAVVVMLAQVDRNIISLMVQPIKRDLDLSDTQISLLLGIAFTIPYAIAGPPMSRVADGSWRKAVIAGSLAVWSLATGLHTLAQGFWSFFASRAAIGAAESASAPASFSMVADAVEPRHLPRAYALFIAGRLGGGALSLMLGGLLLRYLAGYESIAIPGFGQVHSWQLLFALVGLPGLLLALVIALTVPNPRRQSGPGPQKYPVREVFGFVRDQRGMHLPLLGAVLVGSIQSYGAIAWTPAFYERTYGWTPATAGTLLGMVGLISATGGLFLGARVAEWFALRRDDANLRVMCFSHLFAVPFMVLGPLMPNPWLALSLGAVGGVIGTMGGPAYNAALQLSTPNAMRSQVNAMYLFTMGAIGGAIGPTLIPLITDFVAGSEADLRYVLVGVRLLLGPLDAFLIWKAIAPYARAYRARRVAGE